MSGYSKARDQIGKIVNPQVGPIAVLALLLSVFNTAYQLWPRSARPQLLKPEQILVIPDKYPTGHVFVRFAIALSYVNLGPPQKSVVITRESMTYSLGKESFTQHWQSFERFTGRACEVSSTESEDVHPVVLSGQEATGHVTYFAPRVRSAGPEIYSDFLTLREFFEGVAVQNTFAIEVHAEVLDGHGLNQTCTVSISPHERSMIQKGCAVTLLCQESGRPPVESQRFGASSGSAVPYPRQPPP